MDETDRYTGKSLDELDEAEKQKLLRGDYSQYKEPMAIFMADLFDRERSHIARLASKKMDERRSQMLKIQASGRRSLSGSLAQALGMVPPLGRPLDRGDHRKRIQALPEMEPQRPKPKRKPGEKPPRSSPGPVLVNSSGKRGRGRPPGSKNKPKPVNPSGAA